MAKTFPKAWRESIDHYQADQFADGHEPRTVQLRLEWLSKLAALYPSPGEVQMKDLRIYLGSNPRWSASTRRVST